MEVREEFQAFHNYNRLVKEGKVPPILCTQDGFELTTQLGAEGELVLKCYGCGRITVPGRLLIERVVAVVKEFYI